MQVFKTDIKLFWTNELKSWLWTIAFVAFLYWGLKYFPSLKYDNIIVGIVVILLIKLAGTLTQFHVKEIQIDGQSCQMIVILNSKMSGEKIKKYELRQVTSELINNSGLTRYFSSPFSLRLFLTQKDTFVISNRYGFTLDSLTSIDKVLKSMQTKP